jgi:hypothetical protein
MWFEQRQDRKQGWAVPAIVRQKKQDAETIKTLTAEAAVDAKKKP